MQREIVEITVKADKTGIDKEYNAAAGIVAVVKAIGYGEDIKQDSIEFVTFGDGHDLYAIMTALEALMSPMFGVKPMGFSDSTMPFKKLVYTVPMNDVKNKVSILRKMLNILDKVIP